MQSKLDDILSQFQNDIQKIQTLDEIGPLKSKYMGKKGGLSQLMGELKSATPQEKRELGPLINTYKEKMFNALTEKQETIQREKMDRELKAQSIDVTDRHSLRESAPFKGGLHPRTLIQKEIEDIFLSMGFEVLDGPHIEEEFYNFEALNIPADHPARDMQDTFWLEDPASDEGQDRQFLLRTHTSPIQIRGMLERKPPFRFVAPGTVFRCERTDAGHEMVFNQLEGMMVGKDVTVGNLIYFMKTLLRGIFKKDVEVRLRPGFFPFVEPGFELDMRCLICSGKGCSVCKQVGWLEVLPCGMIHPNVLKSGNVDPEEYNGFAFGLGLDRLVMMRYVIDDIRHLQSGDLRFNTQFRSY
jgi:phenylalanyl-tRNA synthetase alpha chain